MTWKNVTGPVTGNSYQIEFQGPYAVSTDSINSHENNTDELHCGKTLIWTLKKCYPWSKVYDVLWSSYIMLLASCPCNRYYSPTHSIKIESSERVGPSVYESFNFTATMTMTGWILCKWGMGEGVNIDSPLKSKEFFIESSRRDRRLRE